MVWGVFSLLHLVFKFLVMSPVFFQRSLRTLCYISTVDAFHLCLVRDPPCVFESLCSCRSRSDRHEGLGFLQFCPLSRSLVAPGFAGFLVFGLILYFCALHDLFAVVVLISAFHPRFYL